ncbi:MAG: hypothetical protein VW879_02445 [Opitutae bacterium]
METLYRLILELLLEYRDSVTITMVADIAAGVNHPYGIDQVDAVVQEYLRDIAYGRNDMSIMDRHEASLTAEAYEEVIEDLKLKEARDAYGQFLFDLDDVPFYDRKEFVEELAAWEASYASPRDFVDALATEEVTDFVFSPDTASQFPDLVRKIRYRRVRGTMLLAERRDTTKLSNDESRDDLLMQEVETNVKRPFDSRGQSNNYDGVMAIGLGEEFQRQNPSISISYLRRRVASRFQAPTRERHLNALGQVVYLDRTYDVVKTRDKLGRFMQKEVKTVTRPGLHRQVVEDSFTGKPMLDIKLSMEMPAKKYWHYQEVIDLLKAPLDRRYQELKSGEHGLDRAELNQAWADQKEAFRVFLAKAKVIKNAVKAFIWHARRGELQLAMNHKYPVWCMKVGASAVTNDKPFFLFVSAYPEKNRDGSDYRHCRVTEFLSSKRKKPEVVETSMAEIDAIQPEIQTEELDDESYW